MPFVIPLLVGIAGPILGLSVIGQAILGTVLSIGLGFVARALTPKPKQPELPSLSAPVADRTQMIRQPVVKRRVVVGEIKIGGILTYLEDTLDDGKRWRMIVTLCDGPIDGIPVVWFGDQPIYADQIDQDGDVTAPPFLRSGAPTCNITKYLGELDQEQNPNLPEGFYGKGVAYLDILVHWNVDQYPEGLPQVSAEVRGRKFVDPRDAGSPLVPRFTLNNAVAARGLLADAGWWGAGHDDDALPDAWFNAAANICDEFVTTADVVHNVHSVIPASGTFRLSDAKLKLQTGDRVQVVSDGTLPSGAPDPAYVIVVRSRNRSAAPKFEVGISPNDGTIAEYVEIKLAASYADAVAGEAAAITTAGSGTMVVNKTGEPRYTVSGMFVSDVGWLTQLDQIIGAMAGRAVYAGGEWRVRAGAYVTPDREILPTHVHGPVKIQTRVPRRDRFNLVRGAYFSPLNDWQPADYPHVGDAGYEAEDLEQIPSDLDLALTTRSNTAQRLAQIELRRIRGNEITVDLTLSMFGMKLQAGDTCMLTLPEFGFDQKPFEVQTWVLGIDSQGDSAALTVQVTLREIQASVYSFNPADDETTVIPVARTALGSAFNVPAPTSLYARTMAVLTGQGDTVYTAIMTWNVLEHGLIRDGGRFELQTQRAAGGALDFDGGSDFVEFGPIDFGAAEITIEGWAFWDGAAGDRGLFTNGQVSIYLRGSDGKIAADFLFVTETLTVASDAALTQDAWTHVAVSFDGNSIILYIDGAAQADVASVPDVGTGDTRITEAADRRITDASDVRVLEAYDSSYASMITPQLGRGKDGTAAIAFWSGMLDDWRIWKGRAKTEAEVAAEMAEALIGREDFLANYWPMDLRFVGVLIDATPAGNNGTITGATFVDGAMGGQWQPSWFVSGEQRVTTLPMLEAAQTYNIRIRTVNALGTRSAWSELDSFTVGSSGGGATDQEDWGSVADAPDSPATDWGAIADAPAETEDRGTVI